MTTPYTPGDREFKADFDTPESVRDGIDLNRRPDAIILNPLISFSMGPVALGDASAGPQDRPWRVRATATDVYVCRANDANTAWEAESVLFSYTGDPIEEIDLSFEQAGRAFVCAERAGRVWLYWFDPILPGFTFQNFAAGRNPRCLLDNPPDTTNSDILCFYMAAGGLVYRQQRDRYQTEYTTPVVDATDKYVERIVKLTDSRVAAVLAVRDQPSGTYTLERLETTLYPYVCPMEALQPNGLLVSGLLTTIVIDFIPDIESIKALADLVSGTCADVIIAYTFHDIDEIQSAADLVSGALPQIVIEYIFFDVDAVQNAADLVSGLLPQVVFDHILYDIETIKAGANLVSGILAP